jgi:hypothetical protein
MWAWLMRMIRIILSRLAYVNENDYHHDFP